MKPAEGTVYCWVVHSGPKKWRAFRGRKEARAYRRVHGGTIYALVRSH